MADSDLMAQPSLSVYFTVDVDGANLGSWTTCSGLGLSIENEPRADSTMTTVMSHVSGKVTYTNLVLGRAVNPDTSKVLSWIDNYTTTLQPTSAEVKALTTDGKTIVSWSLHGVRPVKWTGPQFDAGNLNVATEQLELSYQGFL